MINMYMSQVHVQVTIYISKKLAECHTLFRITDISGILSNSVPRVSSHDQFVITMQIKQISISSNLSLKL